MRSGRSAAFRRGSSCRTTQESFSLSLADYHSVRAIVTLPASSTGTSYCGADQAILILSDNVPPSEATPLVPRVDSPLAGGEAYTAIGFGETGPGSSGQRSRLDGLVVDCVGEGCAAAAMAGRQISLQHEWIGDHGTCSGDSGGPAIDQAGRVAGVSSRGPASCDAPIYGDVFSWAAWIQETAQHAADVGGYTPAPWVTGQPADPAHGGGAPPGCAVRAAFTSDPGPPFSLALVTLGIARVRAGRSGRRRAPPRAEGSGSTRSGVTSATTAVG
jgi:hypothetical protein